MSQSFDMGAERRKRGLSPKELVITSEDEEIEFKAALRPELPVEALDAGAAGRLSDAIRSLFVEPDDAAEFIKRYQPSLDDLGSIMKNVYGQGSLGERLASGS